MSTKPAKVPAAFEPPPTQATTKSGSRPLEQLVALGAGLVTDDALQLTDDVRKRMGPDDRPDAVMRRLDRRHPVAQRLVYGVFECPAPRFDGAHLCAEQLHPEDVERLALDVDGAHIDHAFEPQKGSGGGGGNAMLTGSGLRDEAALSHALGEQRLAEDVVDLVGPGMGEVLAL